MKSVHPQSTLQESCLFRRWVKTYLTKKGMSLQNLTEELHFSQPNRIMLGREARQWTNRFLKTSLSEESNWTWTQNSLRRPLRQISHIWGTTTGQDLCLYIQLIKLTGNSLPPKRGSSLLFTTWCRKIAMLSSLMEESWKIPFERACQISQIFLQVGPNLPEIKPLIDEPCQWTLSKE